MSYATPKRVVNTTDNELANKRPNQLLHVEPARYFGVQYTDGEGVVKRGIFMEVGGVFYAPPGGEKYASDLRQVSDWLQKQLAASPKVNPVNSADLAAALKKEPSVEVF